MLGKRNARIKKKKKSHSLIIIKSTKYYIFNAQIFNTLGDYKKLRIITKDFHSPFKLPAPKDRSTQCLLIVDVQSWMVT